MTNTLSLAARVHGLLNTTATGVWNGRMTPAEQTKLFGIELVDRTAAVIVQLLQDSAIHTTVFDTDRTLLFAKHLDGIQSMVEAKYDHEMGYDYESSLDDDFSVDLYNTFPRDKSAFVMIENKALGRKEETVAVNLDNARRNYAVRHGYADWEEMRALAPEGDRDEDWTVEWTDGTPEECRLRTIATLESEADDLEAAIRSDEPHVVAQDFLDKQAQLFDFALKSRDPEAYEALESLCHDLREKHIALTEANRLAFERWKEVHWLLDMYGANIEAAE